MDRLPCPHSCSFTYQEISKSSYFILHHISYCTVVLPFIHVIDRLMDTLSLSSTITLLLLLFAVLASVTGAMCVVASTAATCPHISPLLYISSVCSILCPPPTTACPPPATATRWWFAAAGSLGRAWGWRATGLSSQCQLCWRETKKVWATDRWNGPKLLTSKPEIMKQWKHHPRRKHSEEKDRGGKKVWERSKKIRTGKEITGPPFISDTWWLLDRDKPLCLQQYTYCIQFCLFLHPNRRRERKMFFTGLKYFQNDLGPVSVVFFVCLRTWIDRWHC